MLHLWILQAKEKRGWTLNSAGYLLGPRKYTERMRTQTHTCSEYAQGVNICENVNETLSLESSLIITFI